MAAPETATAPELRDRPRRALAIVIGIVFLDLLGFGVVIPILPFYVRSFGVTDVVIGLLAASYSIMQFLFAPILGRLSDAHGRRPVLMLSLAGSVIAWTVFGVATEFAAIGVWAGIGVLFVSRMVAGAMGGNIATAQAYIADITPSDRRAGALGLIGAAFSLGFIFGPALGGLLASDGVVTLARRSLPAAVPATAFSLPSFAAAVLSLLALVCTALFLPEPDRNRGPNRRITLVGQFVEALRDQSLRGLVIAFFVVSVAFSGIQVMFIPFAADIYGYTATQTALLLTYIGVLGTLNQGLLVGWLSRRYPSDRLAIAGATLLGVALAVLPFAPTIGRSVMPAALTTVQPWVTPELGMLLVVLAGLSIGNGLLNVSLSTLVSTSASADRQGTAFGVTQGAGSLGRTIGPPTMAALYVIAVPSPFVAGAVLILPVIAILLVRGDGIATREAGP
ncbi:MAG: MFS transporter [Halobacteriales archaeon]|nr:MFS transporter [Halobacteriales archaeon]